MPPLASLTSASCPAPAVPASKLASDDPPVSGLVAAVPPAAIPAEALSAEAEAASATAPEAPPQGPRARRQLDIHSASLALLAVLACLVVLKWAAAVLIPLMLGLMMSYALTPLVDQLERWRIPRALGAGALLLAIVGGAGSAVYWRSNDAASMIESLPAAAQKLRQVLDQAAGAPGKAIDKVQRAAAQLEQGASDAPATPSADREGGVARVKLERPRFDIREYLWTGAMGAVGMLGQLTAVCFIAFFLMSSGDTFRRKIVKIAGRSSFGGKRITVQALDEITQQIQLYLLVQVVTSVLVGIATGLAYAWLGLDHAVVWGIAAAVLNLIPYLGSIAIAGGAALLGLLQFGSVDMALWITGVSMAIHVVSGYLLTPWLTSRAGRMNPVAIFAGVLAWGWLWGVWGLLLGVPILMMVKSICDRVEELKPVGELLGR